MASHSTYADNLRSLVVDHGMAGKALYQPIKRGTHSGLVGDVAFFGDDGEYKWLRNAFYPGVYKHPIVLLTNLGPCPIRVAAVGCV